MQARKTTPLTPAQARYWLGEQRRFMGERGGSLGGYLAFYQPLSSGYSEAEIGAMYAADLAHLRNLERTLREKGSC